VPGSQELASGETSSLLEQLRASRPAWTADGGTFAFVTHRAGASAGEPGESRLWVGEPAGRRLEQAARDPGRLQDLHWSPRGDQLGMVRATGEPAPTLIAGPAHATGPPRVPAASPTLHVWTRAHGLSAALDTRAVRRFAGWCAAGDHLAYVVPDPALGRVLPLWSFLLVPNLLARDAVIVCAGDGTGAQGGKPVFSGLRVTFPHWSPSATDEVLSLWCTFSPSHRSMLSLFLGGGLRPGDPAALLDARTGTLSWMAVSPLEEAQIGHYHQIRHEYAQAWQRYEAAVRGGLTADGAPNRGAQPKTGAEWLAGLLSPRGIAVFQAHCLKKLGRDAEARAKLDQFRQNYPPALPAAPAPGAGTSADISGVALGDAWFRDALAPGGLSQRLLQDLYIAEVLLSIDALEEARSEFQELVDAKRLEPGTAQLSAAIVLSQILLIDGKHDQYAELATGRLAGLLLKAHRVTPPAQPSSNGPDFNRLLPDLAGALALLPLTSKTFLSGLSRERVQSTADRAEALRGDAKNDYARLAVDLVLEACYRQLGQESKRREAAERIEHNAASIGIGSNPGAAPDRGSGDELIEAIRQVVGSRQ
jgi:hypothetical protein